MAESSNTSWDLSRTKADLILANRECSSRGLVQSAKWSAELAFALPQTDVKSIPAQHADLTDTLAEYDQYMLAKSYFDVREYERAAYFTDGCESDKAFFLHAYSTYMAGEKKKDDDTIDATGPTDKVQTDHLRMLRTLLYKKYKKHELDGYCLYLYGVVLKKLGLVQEAGAVDVFVQAIHKAPLHWGAWLELSLLITDKDMLSSLSLPDHWMKRFFLAHTYLELQLNEEALKLYISLRDSGFSRSTYTQAQIAMVYQNTRDMDAALEAFKNLQDRDPCRLESMDIYSNLLYVKEMRPELAQLAHHCCDIDKYRVETCCVIGNYYSLSSEHEKAVLYFQRALRLNPNYLSAWTLMGHEYMEIKNTPAAIQAYRQAIEVNRRDYRAWYGLGQTYEILKMPLYCLYYYRQAAQLRPNDSRMVVALGEAYEKLDRLQEAKKCFWKAHSLGDVEGLALIKLARLYEKLNEQDNAVAAYTEYINETERQGTFNSEDLCQAYRYLANYHINQKNIEEAYTAAQKCTEFNEIREEGKALLRQIARMRSGEDAMMKEEANLSIPGTDRLQQLAHTPVSRLSPMNLTFTT